MSMLSALAFTLLATISFSTLIFFILNYRKRYDGIDVAWGLLFIVASCVMLYLASRSQQVAWPAYVALAMVVVWGGRLAWHIGRRFARSDHEDARYVELRKSWPQHHMPLQIYVRIFLAQALLSVVVALPALSIIYYSNDVHSLAIFGAGFAIWLIGTQIERIADAQLAAFVKDPGNKGQLLQAGLWAQSRHPNYFGELLLWWGIGIAALATPYGWATLIGPLTISYLIIKVSGIPPAEKRMAKKPGWSAYKARTPVLIPYLKSH